MLLFKKCSGKLGLSSIIILVLRSFKRLERRHTIITISTMDVTLRDATSWTACGSSTPPITGLAAGGGRLDTLGSWASLNGRDKEEGNKVDGENAELHCKGGAGIGVVEQCGVSTDWGTLNWAQGFYPPLTIGCRRYRCLTYFQTRFS